MSLTPTKADKSILIIISKSAYQSPTIKEALDIALTCAAFEQVISVLLTDNSVLALLPNQSPLAIGQKAINKQLAALPMYDIESLYIESHAENHLAPHQSVIPNSLIYVDDKEIADLIRSHDIVLRF